MIKLIKILIGLLLVLIMFTIIVGLFAINGDYNTKIKSTPEPTKQEIVTYDLHNGNYISGKDFKSGIYDITASGQGNVSSSNMFDGGINLVAPNEAKNIKLPTGTELKIQGIIGDVTVHMFKKD